MGRTAILFLLACALFLMPAPAGASNGKAGETEGVLVGKITFIEGQLLRYVPDSRDWVAAAKDGPFGLEDTLYAGEGARAEFIMPNNTWIRIGGDTQIQMLTLKADVTEVDVASGVARMYNKAASGVIIKAVTPFGYVVADPGASFDLYVGDKSMEAIALNGRVTFVHIKDDSKYDVIAGSSSVIADNEQITTGTGSVDADWDDWNRQRDSLWSKKLKVKGSSAKYLPSGLRYEAADLEENGRWERIYYEGGYRYFWRPLRVEAGWSPYTVGRWSVWYDDNCWIPYEPFGYVTHHYGGWIYANSYWYWAPPVVSVGAGVGPFLGIGFSWYPGRVAWIHSGVNVGWVPLGWREPYYSYRYWGPRSFVVGDITNINIHINSYRYVDHAVIINRNNFYNVDNYHGVRLSNVNRSGLIKEYRAAPVVNNSVIDNYGNLPQRFGHSSALVSNKPHQSVLGRIDHNRGVIGREGRVADYNSIKRSISGAQRGRITRQATVERPNLSSRLVPANKVHGPSSEVRPERRDLKQKERAVRRTDGQRSKRSSYRQGGTRESQPHRIDRASAGKSGARSGRAGRELMRGEPGGGRMQGQTHGERGGKRFRDQSRIERGGSPQNHQMENRRGGEGPSWGGDVKGGRGNGGGGFGKHGR